jgi:hypothetical protein
MYLLLVFQLITVNAQSGKEYFGWMPAGMFESERLCLAVGKAMGSISKEEKGVKQIICVPSRNPEMI